MYHAIDQDMTYDFMIAMENVNLEKRYRKIRYAHSAQALLNSIIHFDSLCLHPLSWDKPFGVFLFRARVSTTALWACSAPLKRALSVTQRTLEYEASIYGIETHQEEICKADRH